MTETWAYASSTTINITASPAQDLRTKYWPGQWIKITQTTDKFFKVTETAYTSPVTTLTLDGGGLYTVANATITAHSYSIDDAPSGVPYAFKRYPYKLDDLSAPDDNTDLNASTSAHGLMQKYPNTQQRLKGTGAWVDPIFGVNFPFGNGSGVLTAEASTKRIPIASKITKAYIRSLDTDGALKSGSIRIDIYIHAYNGTIGSSVDYFSLSSASSLEETGLNSGNGWSVTAGQYITAITSGITTCEQVVLDLELEAT